MHSPDLYGDNVLSYSSLQRIALETLAPARGFQVGRTVGSFRFSFPCFSQRVPGFGGIRPFRFCPPGPAAEPLPGPLPPVAQSEALQSLEKGERSRRYTQSRYAKGFTRKSRHGEGSFLQRSLTRSPGTASERGRAADREKAFVPIPRGTVFFLRERRPAILRVHLPAHKRPERDFLGYIAGINGIPQRKNS